MKYQNFKTFVFGLALAASVCVSSCKGKAKDASTTADTTTTITVPDVPAPVTINEDDSLNMGLKDATKDYPGVKAIASSGEITLTGDIERSKLPALMQSLNSLRPKKINNNLTIK